MKNREIAKIFNSVADLLEMKGQNVFRIRAYRRAAQNIAGLSKDAAGLSPEELREIPGIGNDLAGKIREIIDTGTLAVYEDLKKDMPEGISGLLSVPGLGPKTVNLLVDTLHVGTVDELERLAKEHKLSGLPGIRQKTEDNILRGIRTIRRGQERFPIGRALPLAEEILERLAMSSPARDLVIAGSLRRWKETIGDIDILATSDAPAKVMSAFVKMPNVGDVLAHGPTKSSVLLEEGIQADLRVVDKKSFGAALAYFTGSKAHNIKLREMAVRRGLKINEYGVFVEKTEKKVGGEKEEDIYSAVGLPYIPPEQREDSGEIDAGLEGRLPELVKLSDIKGDLHVHTKWSDGSFDFADLINKAREIGYEYIAITDHSKGLGVARGLTEERVLDEMRHIDAINARLKGFRVLKGAEVDIRSDMTLDFPDSLLSKLDIVVASIHSGFRQAKSKIMARLESAMKNPFVTVIGHPTGRLIGERDAYDIDIERLLNTAKETGTALEINAYPLRLDLNDSMARRAGEMSVPLIISTDAHILDHFDYMRYGVAVARRAWLRKNNILNTSGAKTILKTLIKKSI